jgi:hypothetical protein
LVVNKLGWRQVGGVSEPGRYMFTFGWLTVTAEDLAVWDQFPDAAFTLVKTAKVAHVEAEEEAGEEFHLGTFELRPSRDED